MGRSLPVRLILVIALCSICAIPILAQTSQIPRQISFQGRLTDPFSVPLPDDDYPITFRLYTVLTGGAAIWSETQTVALEEGVYNVQLGSQNALDLPFDVPYFMGIQVNSDNEMTPRLPLSSAPYAMRAAKIDGGAGSGVDADLLDGQSAEEFLGIGGGSLTGPLSVPALAVDGDTILTIGGDQNMSIFLGRNTDHGTSAGTHNTMLGFSAGSALTASDSNTFVGAYAGEDADESHLNTFIGAWAGQGTTSGDANLFVGSFAGNDNLSGNYNTYVGTSAGAYNAEGSRNVYLGYQAGLHESASDRLYIANSFTSSPLLYGEFDNRLLTVNGTLSIDNHIGPHLTIHDTTNDPNRPGIRFTNNSIHYIAGDDLSDETFGFYGGYGNARTHDARLRVHGKAADDWGAYIGLTHDGTDGFVETDTGDIVLNPGGDVTLADGSDLKVEGSVNGIEFADNSRQTTAGLTQIMYERIYQTTVYSMGAGATAQVTALCPPGYLVTGGGASVNDNLGVQITQMRPLSDSSWQAEFWNGTGGLVENADLTAHVICMQFQ